MCSNFMSRLGRRFIWSFAQFVFYIEIYVKMHVCYIFYRTNMGKRIIIIVAERALLLSLLLLLLLLLAIMTLLLSHSLNLNLLLSRSNLSPYNIHY